MAKALSTPRFPIGYQTFLRGIKERIRAAQVSAVVAVNRELVILYWQIGREILKRQKQYGWGASVIERLSDDMHRAFPDLRGFSSRNLKYMRAFAQAWPNSSIVQQAAAQLPWFHHCILIDKIKNTPEREWYVNQAITHGWSRNVLVHQIESGLYHRQGKAVTNFSRALPDPQSDLAQQLLKDPYNFDFLTIGDDAREQDLEHGLLEQLRSFLLELGVGFAFVGQQVHLEVGGEDFYIDLLFYHLLLHRYVVIDLKAGAFKPEDAGKMNFYLSAVDAKMRHHDDKPSIGLILCKTKNKTVAEYALRDMAKPVGLSSYVTKFTASLPKILKGKLPTIAELKAELR